MGSRRLAVPDAPTEVHAGPQATERTREIFERRHLPGGGIRGLVDGAGGKGWWGWFEWVAGVWGRDLGGQRVSTPVIPVVRGSAPRCSVGTMCVGPSAAAAAVLPRSARKSVSDGDGALRPCPE